MSLFIESAFRSLFAVFFEKLDVEERVAQWKAQRKVMAPKMDDYTMHPIDEMQEEEKE